MRMHYHVMSAPAPLGLLFLGANDQGLQVVEYMDRRSLKRTLADHTRPGAEWEASLHGLRPLADQMDEYFTGARRVFEWPLAPVSSPLQLLVMRAIRRIPYGTTLTVVELAKHIGQPKAVKDVTQCEGAELKRILRTGTVASTDNRNWELLPDQTPQRRFSQSRAVALDMESATIAANGFRFRVPYGTLLCVSDKPLHGEIKQIGRAHV